MTSGQGRGRITSQGGWEKEVSTYFLDELSRESSSRPDRGILFSGEVFGFIYLSLPQPRGEGSNDSENY
jgi:hypothetical protein